MRRALPYLALACWGIALVFSGASRWAASAELSPGDDAPFTLMMLAPAALLAGTVLGWIARATRSGSRAAATAALVLNAGCLAAVVGLTVFALATYAGR